MTTGMMIVAGVGVLSLFFALLLCAVLWGFVKALFKILATLVILMALVIGIYYVHGLWVSWPDKTSVASVTERTVEQPRKDWVFEWTLPRGVYDHGRNKSGPLVAEIIPRADGALWIDIPYVEYGRPEVTRIRLTKISDGSWEGTWEQDNPLDFGRCKLNKVSADAYAGNIVGRARVWAFCTLKTK